MPVKDDEAASPVVGVVLMLALVCMMGVAAALFMPESPFVLESQPAHDHAAVSYCEGHPFQLPACHEGHPVDSGGGSWCAPLFPEMPDSPVKCMSVSVAILVRDPCIKAVAC